MSKKTEIIRLSGLGMKDRAIARALKCSRKTVKKYLESENTINPPAISSLWIIELGWDDIHREYINEIGAVI